MRFACLATALASFASLVIATSPARAQPPPPGGAPAHEPRVGWEVGGGVQVGNMFCKSDQQNRCNGVTEAGGFNLQGSYFFSETLGLTLDVWVMAHTENNFTLSQEIGTIGVKWRLAPILTLQAGVGNAHAGLNYGNLVAARSDDAPAVMGAITLEVLRGKRFALALEGRVGTGFYGDDNNDGQPDTEARNAGLGVQAAWFGF